MPPAIVWYSFEPDLTAREHDPVNLSEAQAVVDRYFAQLRPPDFYSSGEEAVAETMFAFSRDLHDQLELCLDTPFQISMWVQLPKASGLRLLSWFRKPFTFQEVLTSHAAVRRRVQEYFTLSPDEFRAQLINEADHPTGAA